MDIARDHKQQSCCHNRRRQVWSWLAEVGRFDYCTIKSIRGEKEREERERREHEEGDRGGEGEEGREEDNGSLTISDDWQSES